MKIDFKVIGERIKKARKDKEISQAELADKMGVNASYISRVENGSSDINLKRLYEASQILEISIEELLTGAAQDADGYLNREFKEILSKCSVEQQKLIYVIAEKVAKIKF